MNEMLNYIIPIGAIFAFSIACAITRKGFSTQIFLVGIIISISVLVWKESLPFYTMIISALIITGMLFMTTDGEDENE